MHPHVVEIKTWKTPIEGDELERMRAQIAGSDKAVLTIRAMDANRLLATLDARDAEIERLKAEGDTIENIEAENARAMSYARDQARWENARLRAEVEEAKRLYYVAHHEDRPARKRARLLEEALRDMSAYLTGKHDGSVIEPLRDKIDAALKETV